MESVTVELSYDREYPEGYDGPEDPSKRIGVIRNYVLVKGDLTPEQVERLRQIAPRCPVHKTLSAPVRIIDELDAARA